MMDRSRHAVTAILRASLFAAMAICASIVLAQPRREPGSAAERAAAASSGAEAARYVEACLRGLDQGGVKLGCQGTLYSNEVKRLERSALRTLDPSHLTLLGDVYQGTHGRSIDSTQAYRWYLLGAAQGSRLAMDRLSGMYGEGRGVAADPVKAIGYARLAQGLGPAKGADGKRAAAIIRKIGSEMAVEELALADQFAAEMAKHVDSGGEATRTDAGLAGVAPHPGAANLQIPGFTGLSGSGARDSGNTRATLSPPAPVQ